MTEPSLYERLGGVFAIAAVIDRFSDAIVQNPIVGQQSENPALRDWHTNNLGRLPGLKFMRTLWVCNVAGGPFQFSATRPGRTPLGLEEAHRKLRPNSRGPLTSSRCPRRRSRRYLSPSPHTRTR
jgi:hemoglobin